MDDQVHTNVQIYTPGPADDEWDIIIRPARGWAPLDLEELWVYRELLTFLIWRNIKIRYKQTVLGVLWAVIQPLLGMVIFSIFFGKFAGLPSDGVPYPIFSFAALVPWTFFANGLTQGGNSLVEHERMITKIYFPRLLLPLSAVLSGILDFLIALLILIFMLLFYGRLPALQVLSVVLFTLMAALTAFGASLWLAALNVRYRDVRFVIPFLVQVWLFATPVAYSSSIVPAPLRALYGLNPMVGVVEGFRWALLGIAPSSPVMIGVSLLVMGIILISGLFFFRRMEDSFADVV